MAMHLVHELAPVRGRDGKLYAACVIGAPAKDGLWDGALELVDPYGRRLVTPVETRQPDLETLVYWSTGLSTRYVEDALNRAQAAAAAVAAEAYGDRAAEVLDHGQRFRRPARPAARQAPRTRRASTTKRSGARTRRVDRAGR
jgi:hypothetical protein